MTVETTGWNESIPVAGDLVAEGPDNFRATLIRVRARMAHEHAWPSSQTASGQAGYHTFITLSGQTSAPTLTYGTFTTQLAAIYVSSGSKSVLVSDSAGNSYVLVKSGVGVVLVNGTANVGDIPYITTGGGVVMLAAASSGYTLVSGGTTQPPAWQASTAAAPTYGTWNSGSIGSTQTATSDIIVVAYCSGSSGPKIVGETPAGTVRIMDGAGGGLGGQGSITMPVRSGDTWLVTVTNSPTTGCSFLVVQS